MYKTKMKKKINKIICLLYLYIFVSYLFTIYLHDMN